MWTWHESQISKAKCGAHKRQMNEEGKDSSAQVDERGALKTDTQFRLIAAEFYDGETLYRVWILEHSHGESYQ